MWTSHTHEEDRWQRKGKKGKGEEEERRAKAEAEECKMRVVQRKEDEVGCVVAETRAMGLRDYKPGNALKSYQWLIVAIRGVQATHGTFLAIIGCVTLPRG